MTLEEIKAIAETWFDWPEEDRCHVTYTSCMLFAREAGTTPRGLSRQLFTKRKAKGSHGKQ